MTIADELEFDERDSGIGYIVSGSYSDDEGIEYDGINDGDSVSLKYNGERILVRDVSYEDDGVFWGTIHGFEPREPAIKSVIHSGYAILSLK